MGLYQSETENRMVADVISATRKKTNRKDALSNWDAGQVGSLEKPWESHKSLGSLSSRVDRILVQK